MMRSVDDRDLLQITLASQISDAYKEHIDRFIADFDNLSFTNNFSVEKVNEIINRAIADESISQISVPYVQCNVCHQSCASKHLHERENYEPYGRLFSESSIESLSLEQVTGSDVWNLKAVDKTSVYLPMWNACKKWNDLSHSIQQLKEPIQIIQESKRYWTLFIDKYEKDKVELTKLSQQLAGTTPVTYLQDMDEILQLKSIFDKYD
ncbi:unnamed protein product [Didymodactylos carnosus]|uniref:Uncharacterized protein n=1 Tax=Didymodactylos carnosus TaxID=1234261 RepID=A0A815RLD1_9BILA|nr:unnamed protein product [Didymodactylos carnosus]CAF1479305.1 unnamed protein product [Didymodactylos carnosus]CAF3997200.1 unnamed protein product [Didymodactylos carnosus]CAF4344656.1 unnamed protein product [Didymodactylos carnosus]